jgi:hypothetical protein
MSKLDQLRRQREAQHERQERQASAPGIGVSAKSPAVAVPAPEILRRDAKPAEEGARGVCSVCGKLRALNGGLMSNHQKGLGKMCPGSRKAPGRTC